jgi:hypothetical protein
VKGDERDMTFKTFLAICGEYLINPQQVYEDLESHDLTETKGKLTEEGLREFLEENY